ncbi:hypothetical protein GCM10010345_71250 [Streptomyces canarius]|uniref:Uncharacterized protein n=1 Tax=Streptomyces canarius TaxID=285453 RepID=A0ABQ3D3D6_9ACTN|nr:hypothetical protein GCM10010345_71250 [Streptomyces canarius]
MSPYFTKHPSAPLTVAQTWPAAGLAAGAVARRGTVIAEVFETPAGEGPAEAPEARAGTEEMAQTTRPSAVRERFMTQLLDV